MTTTRVSSTILSAKTFLSLIITIIIIAACTNSKPAQTKPYTPNSKDYGALVFSYNSPSEASRSNEDFEKAKKYFQQSLVTYNRRYNRNLKVKFVTSQNTVGGKTNFVIRAVFDPSAPPRPMPPLPGDTTGTTPPRPCPPRPGSTKITSAAIEQFFGDCEPQ